MIYDANGPFGSAEVDIGAYNIKDPMRIAIKVAEVYCEEQYCALDDLDSFPAKVIVTIDGKKYGATMGVRVEPEFFCEMTEALS